MQIFQIIQINARRMVVFKYDQVIENIFFIYTECRGDIPIVSHCRTLKGK